MSIYPLLVLPEDCDPDDLIRKNLDLWQKAVQNYQPAPEWLYEKYKSKLDLKTAAGKKISDGCHVADYWFPERRG